MAALRSLYGLMRADFLERIRRYSFLIVLGVAVFAGYAFVPPHGAPYVTFVVGSHRGFYNSPWVGTLFGVVASTLLALTGFYLVKGAVGRDYQTRVGQVIAATPVARPLYVLGKTEPRPLVIVVEEAHKLLNREMAAQTTFSTIARELRKYYVTLLIIDQRPSQIYDEVMSQLGTRVSGWLGDDDDIRAVLSGLAGREALRGMLARLQPKEEVMLMGWGVPMPLPVRSRRYDDQFWEELLGEKHPKRKSADQELKELGF